MATPRVKSTYSLDLDTARSIDDLARRLNVPKSEVVRRAVRAMATQQGPGDPVALDALDELQGDLALTPDEAARWEDASREERRASSARSEVRGE